MTDNPYMAVGAPSYAAPLVNFFDGGQRQQQQNGTPPQGPQSGPQNRGQAQQGQQGQSGMAAYLARLFGINPQPGAGAMGTYQPNGPAAPGAPMNLAPGASLGPTADPRGLY